MHNSWLAAEWVMVLTDDSPLAGEAEVEGHADALGARPGERVVHSHNDAVAQPRHLHGGMADAGV